MVRKNNVRRKSAQLNFSKLSVNVEAARVSAQLRREAAKMAIEKALSTLSGSLDEKQQDKFLKQSIKNIGDV